jgi:hypothetical protein
MTILVKFQVETIKDAESMARIIVYTGYEAGLDTIEIEFEDLDD